MSRSRHYLTLNASETVRNRDTVRMKYTNTDLHMLYSRLSFRITLSDLQWLMEIFSDRKHCAASLRQLSFLSKTVWNFGLRRNYGDPTSTFCPYRACQPGYVKTTTSRKSQICHTRYKAARQPQEQRMEASQVSNPRLPVGRRMDHGSRREATL